MKKWHVISVLVVVAIVATLFYNKSKMNAATRNAIKDTYYVTVANSETKTLSDSLSISGTIVANSDVNIVSEASGKVTAVMVKAGDFKSAGSVLIKLDDELKRAALMSAEASFEKADKDYKRYVELRAQNSATDLQVDQSKLTLRNAEAQLIIAKKQLADTRITAPISGSITSRNVEQGSMVQPGTVVTNIVDISKLKVKVNVAESDAFLLKTGSSVSVTTDVYQGIRFTGRIESVSDKADEAHTYPVEISIANSKANPLKAGMFARVIFKTNAGKRESVVIPREALLGSVKDASVFVVENGVAHSRRLLLGSETGTYVQVLQGLRTGEAVVTSGQNNLVDNARVEILK